MRYRIELRWEFARRTKQSTDGAHITTAIEGDYANAEEARADAVAQLAAHGVTPGEVWVEPLFNAPPFEDVMRKVRTLQSRPEWRKVD